MIPDPGAQAAKARTATPPQAETAAPGPGHFGAPAPGEVLANRTRALAVGSLVGLIVLSVAWELWLAPTGSGLLALKALPLLIPLAGLLRRRLYTYRWVSLFVWLYFIEGVVRATSDRGPSVWLAIIEVALCLALFAACSAHVWWRLKLAPAAAAAAPEPIRPA